MVLPAATIAFPLVTILGQYGTIDPDFLNRIAILAAGIALFLLVLYNKDAHDKLDAILENQTKRTPDSFNPTNGGSSADVSYTDNFVPGQCGKPGCKKLALTGARACREHVCNFCQVGWTSRGLIKKRACRPCIEKMVLVGFGGIVAGLLSSLLQ